MSPVRSLSREEWEADLRSYGCYPAPGLTRLNTAECWRFPWGGYPFTVPCEDGRLLMSDLDMLHIMLATAAPEGYELPE